MTKSKVLFVAGALVVAGTVAAIAAPHFRGGHHRMGHEGRGPHAHGAGLADRLKSLDTDRNGSISLEEFLSRREGNFARADRNGDGFVDSADIAVRVKEENDYRVRRLLKDFDTDKDGKVSKEEFAKHARDRIAERERMRPDRKGGEGEKSGRGWGDKLESMLGRSERRFARMDRNKDGAIDAADFETRTQQRVDRGLRRIVKRFDTDNDGKVSKQEFEQSARQRFARFDLDDNGRITEDDLPPRMRGRGILK